MEVLNESIYDHPKYYDLVFGADCAAETKFILGCAQLYLSKPAKRFFEPACGTGRLIYHLARKGYDVDGLDLNPKAIEFCNERFEKHGYDFRAFVADMSDFKVKRKFDVAFNTINSFRHLPTEAAARGHMDSMAGAVRVGGLYLLGVHLTPTKAEPSDGESWSARRGYLTVNTHMWTNDRNPKKRVERYGIRFDIHKPSGSFRINDELVLRSYTRKQMDQLISQNGKWETVATYDFGYDLADPIEVDDATEDVVYVLKRKR
ncbi:class I SAM-dependent methyltransferase [Rhodopirellula sp. MGV]|uniref:class I SAM-dependent methyltransferase n=1 Tax=Rhodopirellula sp. MGV TaxID=2023130 RepID=UPI000B96CD85|nr:class I SAM-dependent methyltransferase [Rhodopirellula sp. MGV]OYP33838.1 N,N-dimethyltransferase [Rhodopirellula sp. MGV]PNY34463.1 class I SAM-dependent methyltransferase [Rhodopirellula baltica]